MEGLPSFEYHRPSSLQEAIELLARFGDKAKPIAGGTDLLVQMKQGFVSPTHVVALKWIAGLDVITEEKMLTIGGLATHTKVLGHPVVRGRFPILVDALSRLGSRQVRNVATLGGNLCNAAPSADSAAPLLALDVRVMVMSPQGRREVPLDGFFVRPGETSLKPGDVLTSILIPMPPPCSGGAYLKHTRRAALDLPIIGVAAQCTFSRDFGKIEEVRIGLGVAAPTPIRAKGAEAFLKGKSVQDRILEQAGVIASQEAKPRDTWRGSASYRSEMIQVLVQEAIRLARDRARSI